MDLGCILPGWCGVAFCSYMPGAYGSSETVVGECRTGALDDDVSPLVVATSRSASLRQWLLGIAAGGTGTACDVDLAIQHEHNAYLGVV